MQNKKITFLHLLPRLSIDIANRIFPNDKAMLLYGHAKITERFTLK